MPRTWGVFSLFTSKCAPCHSDVQFFISHSARSLCTPCFGEPIFPLRSHKSLDKHGVSRLFYPFRAPSSSFFWLFLLSDLLASSFSLLALFPPPLFPSVHTAGSLTSKLILLISNHVSIQSMCIISCDVISHHIMSHYVTLSYLQSFYIMYNILHRSICLTKCVWICLYKVNIYIYIQCLI